MKNKGEEAVQNQTPKAQSKVIFCFIGRLACAWQYRLTV
jgi:hypothetical protein